MAAYHLPSVHWAEMFSPLLNVIGSDLGGDVVVVVLVMATVEVVTVFSTDEEDEEDEDEEDEESVVVVVEAEVMAGSKGLGAGDSS